MHVRTGTVRELVKKGQNRTAEKKNKNHTSKEEKKKKFARFSLHSLSAVRVLLSHAFLFGSRAQEERERVLTAEKKSSFDGR